MDRASMWNDGQPSVRSGFGRLDPSADRSLLNAETDFASETSDRAYPFPPASSVRMASREEPSMDLPEVVSMEFRYYDGQQWTDAWDSRERRSLPVAVEVALQVDFKGDKKRRTATESQPRPVDESAANNELVEPIEPVATDLFSELGQPIADQLPVHRFVIYLPQATRRQDSIPSLRPFPSRQIQEPEFPDMPDFPPDDLP